MPRHERLLSLLNVSISHIRRVCVGMFCMGLLIPAGGPGWGATRSAAAATSSQSVALVTGANRGIGLALSTVLAERGWHVIATCRDPEHADELKALSAKYPAVTIDRLDVTDSAALVALAARYRGQPIDVLINNAGILGDPDAQQLGRFDQKTFEDVLRVNAYASPARRAGFPGQRRCQPTEKDHHTHKSRRLHCCRRPSARQLFLSNE